MNEKLRPMPEVDAEWCALATPAPAAIIIAPVRFVHQRNDGSILFSTATLRALMPEPTPAPAVTVAAPEAVATFVPVPIPGPKSVVETWLWRCTAATVAMLVFFLAAIVELVLMVPPPSLPMAAVVAAPGANVPPPSPALLAPHHRH